MKGTSLMFLFGVCVIKSEGFIRRSCTVTETLPGISTTKFCRGRNAGALMKIDYLTWDSKASSLDDSNFIQAYQSLNYLSSNELGDQSQMMFQV
ncbi:hypothetical protein Tsubulata_035839 [Turnera subulata]|uniref:Uncharacterized protein n=1 Tax=Turnera subulata TaxID=218843 RepID=A0A9Q0JNA7_9ROSI|nr:hypothetical protein Tsubulata_035839 [Turnera subulata]